MPETTLDFKVENANRISKEGRKTDPRAEAKVIE